MKRLMCLICLVVFAVAAPAYADTIVFENGDRLTGRVLSEENGKLTLDVDGIGEVSVDAERIILRQAEVTEEAAPVVEDLDTTVEVLGEEIENAEKSPWEAQIDLGATYATGNTDRLGMTFAFVIKRITETDEFMGRFWATYAEENGFRTDNEQIIALRYDWKFEDWYVFTGANAEHDEFEDLDLRLQFLAGAGTWLDRSETSTIKVETAPAATYSDYTTRDSEWAFEWIFAFWGDWKLTDQLSLKQFVRWVPNLTDAPNYRVNWLTELETPLSEKLFGKLAFIWDYNTDPSVGRERSDIRVVLALVYRF